MTAVIRFDKQPDAKTAIVQTLVQEGRPLTGNDLIRMTGLHGVAVAGALNDLLDQGRIVSLGDGKYRVPKHFGERGGR